MKGRPQCRRHYLAEEFTPSQLRAVSQVSRVIAVYLVFLVLCIGPILEGALAASPAVIHGSLGLGLSALGFTFLSVRFFCRVRRALALGEERRAGEA
jgi:hypothetical protein